MNANRIEAGVSPPTTDLACQCSTFSLNDEETVVSGLVFITLWELIFSRSAEKTNK